MKLEIIDVEFLFVRTLPRLKQVEIYFAGQAASTPIPSSFEIRKAEWFAVDDLPDELSKDQREMIKRALRVRKTIN